MCCEQARATLEEFEASITKDSVKHPPPDGTVHPLAAYTLSFLKRLFAYEATIDTLFSDEENEVLLPSPSATCLCTLTLLLLILLLCHFYMLQPDTPNQTQRF